MSSDILQCIQVRKDFFEKYYSVPVNIQPEVDAFLNELHILGEQVNNAQDFEANFAQNGFQERFTYLLTCCAPKAYKMTNEEKETAKETAKEIFKEDRSRIVKEAVADAADYASVMIEEEVIAQKRKIMIEADVFDDYTRATNAIDIAKNAGGLLKGIFKKKK